MKSYYDFKEDDPLTDKIYKPYYDELIKHIPKSTFIISLAYDIKTTNVLEYNNNLKVMLDDIELNPNKTYIITHTDIKKLEHIEDILDGK